MMKNRLLLIFVCLAVDITCAHLVQRGALSYVVDRGCMYLARVQWDLRNCTHITMKEAMKDDWIFTIDGPTHNYNGRTVKVESLYVRNNYFDETPIRRQASVTKGTTETSTIMPRTTETSTIMPETTTNVNWVTYLYQIMTADYVPMELFKGLVNCGREYSMFAINAPTDLTKALQINYNNVPGLGK